ncbi:MAG: hypothetical protein C5B47_02315 [Verrucomicrobia bacterium]|nr:MAG: hypothetical protein C5B47_02315 [Verrucomicrobiota bacterium]
MLTTTANELAGYRVVRQLGIIRGIMVRSPNIAQGVLGGLKMMIGGRNQAYTRVCEKAREEALNALIQQAQERGANAVLAVRYDATEFLQGATEVLAYGTAVFVQPFAGPNS